MFAGGCRLVWILLYCPSVYFSNSLFPDMQGSRETFQQISKQVLKLILHYACTRMHSSRTQEYSIANIHRGEFRESSFRDAPDFDLHTSPRTPSREDKRAICNLTSLRKFSLSDWSTDPVVWIIRKAVLASSILAYCTVNYV